MFARPLPLRCPYCKCKLIWVNAMADRGMDPLKHYTDAVGEFSTFRLWRRVCEEVYGPDSTDRELHQHAIRAVNNGEDDNLSMLAGGYLDAFEKLRDSIEDLQVALVAVAAQNDT
jgi:hypothetical protein